MRKFESSQKDESRAQLADSSKAYRKRRAFYCARKWLKIIFFQKPRILFGLRKNVLKKQI